MGSRVVICILEGLKVNKTEKNVSVLCFTQYVEFNFQPVKRTHAAVLQEIESGKVDWNQLDLVEKIKNRYTQRLIHFSPLMARDKLNGGVR